MCMRSGLCQNGLLLALLSGLVGDAEGFDDALGRDGDRFVVDGFAVLRGAVE